MDIMTKKVALLFGLFVTSLAVIAILSVRDNPARPTDGEARHTFNDGHLIRYYVKGELDAEPVILLASYARSGSDFNELVESISLAGYRTIVVQARGIDGSELPDSAVSLFDYAEDVAAVVRQERLSQPVTLIGHAFGNRVVRAYSSRYPNRVRSMVLLAAGDSSPPPKTRNDIIMILIGTLPESIRTRALQRAFFAPGNHVPSHWISGWYPRAGLAQGKATATTPHDQWIHGGNAPILVVQPTHDAAAEYGANKLRSLYPDRVTALSLEGSGHAILPEQPEQVARLVLDHLVGRSHREKEPPR